MDLGTFSVSLAVRDLAASRAFYETLGFEVIEGDQEQGWLVLRNGTTAIGLFHGMFERNMLTFNPGWRWVSSSGMPEPIAEFTDVRELQERLDAAGIELAERADPDGTGPAHLALVDPDGNPVLVDQHVPRPGATPQA